MDLATPQDTKEDSDAMEIAPSLSEPAAAPPPNVDKNVCPYCGLVGPRAEGPCARCTIEDTPQTRQATKSRIGPWYVLQNRNPAAPGMKWSTLLALVKKGQVSPRSVVRGPTTHQLWRLASQVKGLSREFGVCFSCGGTIEKSTNQCPHCDRLQEPPANPDALLESREPVRRSVATDETSVVLASLPNAPVRNDVAEPSRDLSKPDAGLMSFKELAAAFQLDVKSPPPAAVPTKATGAKQSSVEPAVVEAPPRRSFGRIVMVMILLSLVGVTAVIWMNPPYQAKAKEIINDGWSGLKNQLSTIGGSSTVETNEPPKNEPQAEVTEPTRKVEPPPVTQKKVDPPANPPVTANQTIPTDPEEIRQLVRKLRSSAIDAEAAGDFAKAVRQYEQIKKVPREYWPSDLDLRLTGAKAKLN